MDYKSSGVDIEAGRAFVDRIKASVQATHRSEVVGGLGGFGGLIRLPPGLQHPILVAGTDGVGTKLEVAQQYNFHFGVGIDLVAMCVNDVITSGAEPLFFLDYIATGSLSPKAMAEVIEGIAEGCKQSGCSLLGGETAEMPGFYPQGKYDLAGFCVAVVDEPSLIDGSLIQPEDQIVGIASSGVHSNGFSLVRKVLEMQKVNKKSCFGENKLPIIDTLLTPTILYSRLVSRLLKASIPIKGMAHITGGGLPENLPRCFPDGLSPVIDPMSWTRPELFTWLQQAGDIPEMDLWNTFNLGIGFCLVLSKEGVNDLLQICNEENLDGWVIGKVQESFPGDQQILRGVPN